MTFVIKSKKATYLIKFEYIKHYTLFDNKYRFFKNDNKCRLIKNVAIPTVSILKNLTIEKPHLEFVSFDVFLHSVNNEQKAAGKEGETRNICKKASLFSFITTPSVFLMSFPVFVMAVCTACLGVSLAPHLFQEFGISSTVSGYYFLCFGSGLLEYK